MKAGQYHQPVMLQEAVTGLAIRSGGIYVDATFGGGGHSAAILGQLGEQGRLIAFDQDNSAGQQVIADPRLQFVPENFRHLHRFLKLYGAVPVNGLLADLGVSSHQLDTPERGFSTRFEGRLDMRMDQRNELTAETILHEYPEGELHKLFERYGEISNARTLAKTIAAARNNIRIRTTTVLQQLLRPVIKGNPHRYYAQVFQALRIAVNDEMGALEELLEQALQVLGPGGRLVIITFHSLEDRIVKNFMKTGKAYPAEDILPEAPFRLVTKKPMTAAAEEIRTNPRSRSAKLRIAEKK